MQHTLSTETLSVRWGPRHALVSRLGTNTHTTFADFRTGYKRPPTDTALWTPRCPDPTLMDSRPSDTGYLGSYLDGILPFGYWTPWEMQLSYDQHRRSNTPGSVAL
jgi:hypothetical protein